MKKCYVCVLSTDNYLEGVLVLNENLKSLNSRYELLCLINENISSKSINILEYMNIKYKKIKSIGYKTINEIHPHWKYTFDKLNAFSLVEYDQIVLLDVDILILKNIDHLFDIKKIASPLDYPWHKDRHSSGIMVIIPNLDDYNKMIKLVNKNDNEDKKIGDQDIINEYFKDIEVLSKEYNVTRQILPYCGLCYDYVSSNLIEKNLIHTFQKENEKSMILHYAGELKPFMLHLNFDDKYSYQYLLYLNIVRNKISKLYTSSTNELLIIDSLDKFKEKLKEFDYKYVLFTNNKKINTNTIKIALEKMKLYNLDFCEINYNESIDNLIWENQIYLNNTESIKNDFFNNYIKNTFDNKIINIDFLSKFLYVNNKEELLNLIITNSKSVLLINDFL